MMTKVGFAIPCVYENFLINKILILLLKEHPEYFYENIQIDAIFGNFPYCIWDGGRKFNKYTHATLEEIEEIRNFYNDHNIPLRFIYTNTEITKDNLNDRFCNLVTELCENELNEIVINSSVLEEYIRINYPKYKIISSTTKCLNNIEKTINELNKNYYRVCLDYNLNYNLNFLKSLSNSQKEKVELLVNATCGINCLNRNKHYKLNSISALNYGKDYALDFCNLKGRHLYPCEPRLTGAIPIDDILTTYKDLGIMHFKLEGRSNTPLLHILNIIRFLIKPEYQLFVISIIYNKFEKESDL